MSLTLFSGVLVRFR